jgi:hypothetical protein
MRALGITEVRAGNLLVHPVNVMVTTCVCAALGPSDDLAVLVGWRRHSAPLPCYLC